MTFAGFWVDGAVRKPEARHCDSDDTVIAKWKRKGDERTIGVSNEFDICRRSFSKWDCVYWLDTTPRESLTPEELLSVAKVLSPSASRVEKRNDGPFTFWIVDDEESAVKVDWGNLTQYPPPAEPQWVRITRENVGQYLFRECRFRDSDSQEWRNGRVAGWCETDHNCLVNSDFSDELFVMQWSIVEVQNAPST